MNGWYTTTELEQFGIGQRLAYTWFSLLEGVGYARRAPGGKHGILLFRPEAKEFLIARKRRTGKPRGSPTAAEQTTLSKAIKENWPLERIAVALTISPSVAKDWLEDFAASKGSEGRETCTDHQ